MGVRRGGPLRTVRAALDKLRHKAIEFAQQARVENPNRRKPGLNLSDESEDACLNNVIYDEHVLCVHGCDALTTTATLRVPVQVANPPLVGVLTGIAVGLTPVGSVLFDPAGATAQVTPCCL